jgi:hypothetical protein
VKSSRRTIGILTATLTGLLWTPELHAESQKWPAVARAGGGQAALTVAPDKAGALRAAVCQKPPCSVLQGDPLPVPAELSGKAAQAEATVVPIGQNRRAIIVSVPAASGPLQDPATPKWQALLVARPGSQKAEILYSGRTGLIEGEQGERRGALLMISDPAAGGGRRILLGEQLEELSLCGRPAIYAPKVLNAADLKFYPAKYQRLSLAEQAQAKRLSAARITEDATAQISNPLRARAASSAAKDVGNPEALTDGNLDTAWAEDRGGDGKGEFVLLRVPQGLRMNGFRLAIRPPKKPVESGVAPRELWLVTDDQLFHVTLPEDAWQQPGARYRIDLPSAVVTECVALVLEKAFDENPKAKVTVAELEPITDFDALSSNALVDALKGGGERAEAAKNALAARGPEAYAAIDRRFDELDGPGRQLALDVMDQADCRAALGTYVRAMHQGRPAQRRHIASRIRRCGDQAGDLLAELLTRRPAREQPTIAAVLADAAPARAVPAIVALLNVEDPERRRKLRTALARATRSARAERAVRQLLADERVPITARLDLLRALGSRASKFTPQAARALERLAASGARTFRIRYLLLEPAAALAPASATAKNFLSNAITADHSEHVRAQAARVVDRPSLFRNELLKALEDPGVRVREAAVVSLNSGQFGAGALLERLQEDKWPLVRSAAATSLSAVGPNAKVDEGYCTAIEKDAAPMVRSAALRAVGSRGTTRCLKTVRERLEDTEETPEVRVAAADSLGLLCDAGSVSVLTRYAERASDRMLEPTMRRISMASIRALGRIHPADLPKRLGKLRHQKTPPPVLQEIDRALGMPARCTPGKPRRR